MTIDPRQHHRAISERMRLDRSTETREVRVYAAREHARALVVASYRQTWMSSGGIYYRKRPTEMWGDLLRAKECVQTLAWYVLGDFLGKNADALWSELVREAVAKGELVDDGHRTFYPPSEEDREWVASLTVRTRP